LKIGHYARQKKLHMHVYFDFRCFSSCVIALAGGVVRLPFGDVGIHSIYSEAWLGSFDFSGADQQYNRVLDEVRGYLIRMGVNASLVDEMIKVDHERIKILSFEENVGLGLMGVDPVYRQSVKE
jgi:hypothetical protein